MPCCYLYLPHAVAFYAAENLNWHLKMNAKCSVYIAMLPYFTKTDANMLGRIFRRIIPEQIFILDESKSHTTSPALEYTLIKKLNDEGMFNKNQLNNYYEKWKYFLDEFLVRKICPNGPNVARTAIWTKEQGLNTIAETKDHNVNKCPKYNSVSYTGDLSVHFFCLLVVQQPALGQSQGSVKNFLGSSTGWWADTKLNIKNPHVEGLFIPRLMLRIPPILAVN